MFKTTDGGVSWDAVFDDQPVSSIGALAVAPSDASVVWAGTGEAFIGLIIRRLALASDSSAAAPPLRG